MKKPRPSEAVFADGRNARPLAIHPKAIGVSYATRDTECVAEVIDGVAVLCVDGPLEHKSGDLCSFWQTYEDLARDFKGLLEDGSVRTVMLKFDSPGGECAGLNETVAIMQGMKAKSGKPVVAYVDEACYSAAYALAMVADEIYMPESAGVGSIGVITAMADITELNKKEGIRIEVIASGTKKTDGHPDVALTDGAISRTRAIVDKLAASFFDIVGASRGIPPKTIAGYQAGTFTGQSAVDAGLVDGIMSLTECLQLASKEFSSSNTPSSRTAEKDTDPMAGKLAAAKALNDAHKAMAASKTDAERAIAAARILAAENESKVTKTKTVTTDTHEEEIDDGEEEKKIDVFDEDGEDEDEEEDAPEEKAAASAVGRTMSSVVALARKITGKRSIDEVMGAMQAMHDSHKKTSKLAAEVAQLRADNEAGKVAALVSQGLKAGKLAPAQRAWAKTQSPASLKAYLDAAPRMVHTADEEHTEARVDGTGAGSVTAEMAKIWKKQGFTEADFPKLVEKLNGAAKRMNGAS